ncbi:PucR family transcriptional regulator [Streptomyces tubercidicus]|uniref:PucR family transcriptional regulator n=1 Tax=Streptomyces tubercidicus TaxID=47759 RepID=UPI0034657B8D
MPPTLHSLLARRDLALRPVVAAEPDRPVRWVHISELNDPTPYLEGGELLLTTGLQQDNAHPGWEDYVARLVDCEVAGLAFGVGLRHNEIPADLVAAARRLSLPLLEVPATTPFIAISKAVANAITRDEQLALTGALDAQRDLIRAALASGGAREVTTRLARALGCWVLLLDRSGALRYCAPDTARKHVARVCMDIEQLNITDPQRSAALSIGGDTVVVLPMGVYRHVEGFLVSGRPAPLRPAERSVLSTAVGLLSLDLYRQWDLREGERRARAAVVELAVRGHAELAVQLSEILGLPFPNPPLRVAVLGAPREQLPELLQSAEEHQGLRLVSALTAGHDSDALLVLLSAAQGDTMCLEEVLMRVPQSRGAVSDPTPLGELPDAWRRVQSVFHASPTSGRLVIAQDLAAAGLLRHLGTPDALGWAGSLLEPLDRHASRSKLDLVETLQIFLAHNGLIDASASELGIHRHTLRYRLKRIAELLDCDLDNPTVRVELWVALRLRDRL